MQATIDERGRLVISATNETEAYALRHWAKSRQSTHAEFYLVGSELSIKVPEKDDTQKLAELAERISQSREAK